jgi:hypothetical protein
VGGVDTDIRLSMNEEQLIEAIRRRAANPATRTDIVAEPREVAAPITRADIEAAEHKLGFALHPLHRRLFEEVGNGGFGPGDGLIGLPGGALDVHGHSLLELRGIVLRIEPGSSSATPVVPLCDWGDAIWSCIDCETGAVLSVDEFGIKAIGQTIHPWLEDWVAGVSLFRRMVVLGETTIQNFSTKELITVEVVAGLAGTPYVARSK